MRFLAFAFAFLVLAYSYSARAEFGLYAGTHFGYGSEGRDTNDAYLKRTVGVLDFQAMPGMKLYGKVLLVGLLFDLRLLSQLSNVDTQAVGDFGGSGLLLGPGIALDFPYGKILLSYDLRARQSIHSPDATFKGSGFHFLIGYKAMPRFSLDFEYVATHYKTVSVLGVDNDLSGNPMTHNNIGAGVSLIF